MQHRRGRGHKRIWWPDVTGLGGALQPAQLSTLHVLYINNSIRDTSYHLYCISVVFVLDLREVLSLCLVPPACTSATGITLKNAFDKYIADVAFCCWTEAVCMDVWTDKPTLATLAGSKHWSFTEAATNTSSSCIEDVIYVTRRLAQGPTGLFLQYLDNCECIDIILPACCAFSLCYPFQREFWEEESWQSEALFLFLHSSLSLFLFLSRWDQMEGSEEG